jgi:hypothetical protein
VWIFRFEHNSGSMCCTIFAVGMKHEHLAVLFLCRSKSRSVDHGFSPPFDLDALRSKVEGRFESVGRGMLTLNLLMSYIQLLVKPEILTSYTYVWQR